MLFLDQEIINGFGKKKWWLVCAIKIDDENSILHQDARPSRQIVGVYKPVATNVPAGRDAHPDPRALHSQAASPATAPFTGSSPR